MRGNGDAGTSGVGDGVLAAGGGGGGQDPPQRLPLDGRPQKRLHKLDVTPDLLSALLWP